MRFFPLEYNNSAGNCPECGVYSKFDWRYVQCQANQMGSHDSNYESGRCEHCGFITLWHVERDRNMSQTVKLIYPTKGTTPLPNEDMPEDVKGDYIEASTIVELSPRGSAALLRLAVQKLCKHLGEKGENINTDIKSLVGKGLHPSIQMALDSVRVTGNYAVHPGVIDLTDDRDTAIKLFGFVNVIVDVMISQPKQINEFYNLNVPEKDKENILKRDMPKATK